MTAALKNALDAIAKPGFGENQKPMKRLALKDAKPCPFCGGKKLETFDIGGVSYLTIRCLGCEAEGPQEDDDEQVHSAVVRWNRRV